MPSTFSSASSGTGRSAHGRGDGDAELVHRHLDRPNGRIAVRAEGKEQEYAPVQFCSFVEVADMRGVHQLDVKLGATLAKAHMEPSAPASREGRIRSSQPESTEKSDLTRFTSRSTPRCGSTL
jgi:hypothetical protein